MRVDNQPKGQSSGRKYIGSEKSASSGSDDNDVQPEVSSEE